MGTKMKGLIKGLRYISQIFAEDEKEPEIQIGYPTDVKHVAHIGWDGPSVDSPSWMNEFKSPGAFQSAPLDATGGPIENPEIKWVSEDSNRRSPHNPNPSARRDLPELPKSSRHPSLTENSLTTDSPKKESSSKSRHSRRHHSKDSSESSKPTRVPQDPSHGPESPSRKAPGIPKKSRRKKSKESMGGGSMRPSRMKGDTSTSTSYTSPFSDPGPETGSMNKNDPHTSNMKSPLKDARVEEKSKGNSRIS